MILRAVSGLGRLCGWGSLSGEGSGGEARWFIDVSRGCKRGREGG